MKNLHTLWKHRWVTQKAKVRKSKIHGLGIVAIKPISKGGIVAVLGGVIVPLSEIKEYYKKLGHFGIQIDDNFYICPTSRKELEEVGVINHSCGPNIGYSNSITFVAIKNIKPGEELVFDYAFSESALEPFKCECGSGNCRKIIRPDDWKIKEIQKKYRMYFSPYLKRKINSKNE